MQVWGEELEMFQKPTGQLCSHPSMNLTCRGKPGPGNTACRTIMIQMVS